MSKDLLASCVVNSLEMAKLLEVPSISIPSISSGIFGFPKELCADIMIKFSIRWFIS